MALHSTLVIGGRNIMTYGSIAEVIGRGTHLNCRFLSITGLHHKHNSVGNMNIENWDFGGEAKRKDNGESLSSSTITDAEWETEEPEQITELRKSQNNTESNGRGGVTFDLPSVEPKTELKPNAPPPPKKHISFGEVVVKNPPYPAAPSQPQAFASPDTATPPIAPVAQPSRRSRFVFEESHLPAPASNAVPTTPTMTTSEHVVPTTTAVTLFSPPPPTLFHALMAPSTLSASESRVEPQDKPLVGLGLVNNGAGSKEITAPPGSALVTPGNQEVRKGRFSVTEGAVHPRSTTPGLEGSGDVVSSLHSSARLYIHAVYLQPYRTNPPSSVFPIDRKSRFELQHQNSIPSSQLPPPLPTSATGPLQPGPTIPMQRVDGVPLSREGSFSSTASLTRGDGLAAKVSRFSVESRHEVHMKETVVENTSVVVVEGKERECKKKGSSGGGFGYFR
ncbi:hypothetical protein BC938DRAFT_476422 [Jimgerdemannia flammicorona]|uniref:Uncharacterized protein n=1 Tax=Jimgerdemannia flammicorona TaxID=994334 RepID=A0A433PHF8_9FUNG|nr:hypothetical protein BC938DRAFT_476422 [Jimgerdemannia flammicorona]